MNRGLDPKRGTMKTVSQERKIGNARTSRQASVDHVAYDARRGEYALYLIERDIPDNAGEYLRHLQDKLLSYLNYILSGEMAIAHPDSIQKPVRFRFIYFEHLNDEVAHFMDLITSLLRTLDLQFDICVLSEPPSVASRELSGAAEPMDLKM